MDPVTTAALIGGGASLLGIGSSKSTSKKQLKLDKERFAYQKQYNQLAREDTRYYYDQSADRKIQRQVADGRKAGLSALASMGAPPQALPNIQIGQTTKRSAGNNSGEFLIQLAGSAFNAMNNYQRMELTRMNHAETMARLGKGQATAYPMTMDPRPTGTQLKNESSTGDVVNAQGKLVKDAIPPGTPSQRLEEEIGEWSTLFQTRRAITLASKILGKDIKDEIKNTKSPQAWKTLIRNNPDLVPGLRMLVKMLRYYQPSHSPTHKTPPKKWFNQ